MWSVYFKIALRHLTTHKFYTFINVFGLSVGVACSLLILLYLQHEFSYDRHFPEHERIFRIGVDFRTEKEVRQMAAAHPALGRYLAQGFPEQIEAVTKVLPTEGTILNYGESNIFSTDVFFADPNYFKIFQHEVLAGNLAKALTDSQSIVLTQSVAKELFGEEGALGRWVNIRSTNLFRYDGAYRVRAVIADPPQNAHLPFKALISWNSQDRFVRTSWVYTYFKTKNQGDLDVIKAEWDDFYKQYLEELQLTEAYHIFNINEIHLYSTLTAEPYTVGNINYLYVFLIVAIFVTAIACMNYVNMTTARSAQRLKEVGVRKVLGSHRSALMGQFLVESAFLTAISFVVALSLVELSLPYFNEITEKKLQLLDLYRTQLFPVILVFFGIVVLLAGLYPAFYLSALRPLQALKGNIRAGTQHISLRKILVIAQFTIAIITMVGTGVVYQQLAYLRNRDLGLQKNNILVIRLPQNEMILKHLEKIKQELLKSPHIYRVGNAADVPGDKLPSEFLFEVQSEKGWKKEQMARMIVNYDFLETLDIRLLSGRNFQPDNEADYQESILINEAAAEYLGWREAPLGRQMVSRNAQGQPQIHKVIGVVKNFHVSSLHSPVAPMVLIGRRRVGNLFLNIEARKLKEVLTHLSEAWAKSVPEEPLSYFFLDENFQQHYLAEEKLGQVLGYFSLLAVAISCLGLLGLASYTTEIRTKEIGIRKVLGATMESLILLLSKDFIKLVVVAIILAMPLGYYAISKWLDNFAYKTEVQWAIFLWAAFIAFVAALLPLSLQTLKTLSMNPVKALRNE
jgi:putative ABC transport system permease protein